MSTQYDFLKQGVKQIRKSIKDIDDSYNNDWDIVAELLQNAVDAIRKKGELHGEIDIDINSQDRSIRVRDNGIGMTPNEVPELLAPFSTNKEDDEESIGEKGVGLTFVLFTCNDFHIITGNGKVASEGHVRDAYTWKNSSADDVPRLIHQMSEEKYTGTAITLRKVVDSPIFELSFNQLKFVLRTRTAIGNTSSIWNSETNITVNLTYTNQDGDTKNEILPFKYWLPTEGLDKNGKISISEYNEFLKIKDRTDQEKRLRLKDKILYNTYTFDHNGRTIRAYSCFVPKRKVWDDLTKHHDIATEEQLTNDQWLDKHNYACMQPGIFTSVKSMPTGVTVDHPITGASGAWPQIFILFEDRQLKFDIGRKSIHGSQARIYKKYAREIFSEYQRHAKYISGDVIVDSEWDKEETFAEIDAMLDLNVDGIKLKKNPKDQEASVAGLYFECIGNGLIDGINPLVSGYKNKYDLYATWGNKKLVIEIKSSLAKILKDFSDETKLFNEVNCVVCWNVTEDDIEILSRRGIDVETYEESGLPGTSKKSIPGTTHLLRLSGFVNPISVVDMKIIISK